MTTLRITNRVFVALMACVVSAIILSSGQYSNPASQLLKTLQPYLPGHDAPGCSMVYYTGSISGCVIYAVPGTTMVSLTINEASGKIDNTFVMLTDPVRVGDLSLLLGVYTRDRFGRAWRWEWGSGLRVYKYSQYGHPTKLTEVKMLSWRN